MANPIEPRCQKMPSIVAPFLVKFRIAIETIIEKSPHLKYLISFIGKFSHFS